MSTEEDDLWEKLFILQEDVAEEFSLPVRINVGVAAEIVGVAAAYPVQINSLTNDGDGTEGCASYDEDTLIVDEFDENTPANCSETELSSRGDGTSCSFSGSNLDMHEDLTIRVTIKRGKRQMEHVDTLHPPRAPKIKSKVRGRGSGRQPKYPIYQAPEAIIHCDACERVVVEPILQDYIVRQVAATTGITNLTKVCNICANDALVSWYQLLRANSIILPTVNAPTSGICHSCSRELLLVSPTKCWGCTARETDHGSTNWCIVCKKYKKRLDKTIAITGNRVYNAFIDKYPQISYTLHPNDVACRECATVVPKPHHLPIVPLFRSLTCICCKRRASKMAGTDKAIAQECLREMDPDLLNQRYITICTKCIDQFLNGDRILSCNTIISHMCCVCNIVRDCFPGRQSRATQMVKKLTGCEMVRGGVICRHCASRYYRVTTSLSAQA